MNTPRRLFLKQGAAALAGAWTALEGRAAEAEAPRRFAPNADDGWRSFEVTTRVDVAWPQGVTQVWLPVPSIDGEFQRSEGNSFTTNGQAVLTSDAGGTRMLHARFAPDVREPFVELTSRVQTRNRAVDWSQRRMRHEDPAVVAHYTRATRLLPTDGIVRSTAVDAVRGARTDTERVRRLYDWVVSNTYREPRVRGCGEGDIKTMLETGNLGGKCADLNALFVGLCRSIGIPARDVYGLRLAPSRFGYRELSGNSGNLKAAQHCRAEVFLKAHGWVAMDPADVAKVMRQETPDWIKTTDHPVVRPVSEGLFGGWEGNWLGWNTGHDVALPGASRPPLAFFMYPAAETAVGPLDPYAPDDFRYRITAREIKAA